MKRPKPRGNKKCNPEKSEVKRYNQLAITKTVCFIQLDDGVAILLSQQQCQYNHMVLSLHFFLISKCDRVSFYTIGNGFYNVFTLENISHEKKKKKMILFMYRHTHTLSETYSFPLMLFKASTAIATVTTAVITIMSQISYCMKPLYFFFCFPFKHLNHYNDDEVP